MNKISRVIVSALLSLAAALTAAVALSAPAQAMTVAANTNTNPSMQVVSVTLSDADIAKVAVSWHWAEALCADTSDAVVTTSSSWFKLERPDARTVRSVWIAARGTCSTASKAGGRSVTFANYAGPMGWTYWKDTCSLLTP